MIVKTLENKGSKLIANPNTYTVSLSTKKKWYEYETFTFDKFF